MSIKVTFIDSGREPQCPANPKYPEGMDIDLTHGSKMPSCDVKLPYPAPRCGAMLLECDVCGYRIVMTVAGRVDDPRTVKIPCKTGTH